MTHREKRTRSQVYAIRRRVKGYALSNDFKWFATLTYNPQQIDSLNYDIAQKYTIKMVSLDERQVSKIRLSADTGIT